VAGCVDAAARAKGCGQWSALALGGDLGKRCHRPARPVWLAAKLFARHSAVCFGAGPTRACQGLTWAAVCGARQPWAVTQVSAAAAASPQPPSPPAPSPQAPQLRPARPARLAARLFARPAVGCFRAGLQQGPTRARAPRAAAGRERQP